MKTRSVKINGTNLVVDVPVYGVDWVRYVAIDEDGGIWMYSHKPKLMGFNIWAIHGVDDEAKNAEPLPEAGSQKPARAVSMEGIDYTETLTEVGEAEITIISSADLAAISAAAGELILACSGDHPDISQDDTGKICSLWDNFNDVLAPPDVVKAMADEILSARKQEAR